MRDAVYQAIPWTRRRSLHTSVARSLDGAGASAAERATHWLGAGDVERARSALGEAAAASERVYAYRDAAKLYERALDLAGGTDLVRFELLERLAVCAELAGDLAASARAWREAIDGRRGRGEVERVAEAEHAIGRVLALRGSTERALAAWFAAADAFAACERHEDAARSRLAAANVLQYTGRLQPALAAAEAVLAGLPPGAAVELHSRARSLRGVVLGKLGQTARARDSVAEALSEALSAGHQPSAAAAYQALAVVHENAGEFGAATEAYEVAIDYCESTGVATTGYICSACLCHVLRQRGEWRRSLALCRSLLDDPSTDEESRAIAAVVMSQIHACRGERRPARLRVMEAAPVVRQMQRVRGRDGVRLDVRPARAARGLRGHCRRALPRDPPALGGERRPPLQPQRPVVVDGRVRGRRARRGPESGRSGARDDRRRRTATPRRSQCSPAPSASSRAPRAPRTPRSSTSSARSSCTARSSCRTIARRCS